MKFFINENPDETAIHLMNDIAKRYENENKYLFAQQLNKGYIIRIINEDGDQFFFFAEIVAHSDGRIDVLFDNVAEQLDAPFVYKIYSMNELAQALDDYEDCATAFELSMNNEGFCELDKIRAKSLFSKTLMSDRFLEDMENLF